MHPSIAKMSAKPSTSKTVNQFDFELEAAVASILEPQPALKTMIIDHNSCLKRKRIAHERKVTTGTKKKISTLNQENQKKKD